MQDKMQRFPAGVFAPIVTPFLNEEIRYEAFVANILRYNETPLRGYMPLGSNGKFQGLTDTEMLKLLQLMAQNKAPDKVVVAGCGRESAYATVEFIKKATGITDEVLPEVPKGILKI